MDWYQNDSSQVLQQLGSREEGLTPEEVEGKLQTHGPNALQEKKRASLIVLFARQFLNPLVGILIAAALVKLVLGSTLEGSVILGTVLFMVTIAFFQESKAEKAIEALKDLSSPQCRVRRNGKAELVDSHTLVPGDILLVEAGDKMAADARLISTANLRVSEAILTGESEPIDKEVAPIDREEGLAGRRNMLYSGTTAVYGKGVAVVTETGMATEIGKIAEQMQATHKEKTPLQKGIEKLSQGMLIVVSILVAAIVTLGLLSGMELLRLFILSVSVAVAAIPEGLPAVVTVVLASGVHLLAKKQALVRKLVAVETLGSTTVICTDKTGTLTLNHMELVEVYASHLHKVDELSDDLIETNVNLKGTFEVGVLCNDTTKSSDGTYLGDPTEAAIVSRYEGMGLHKERLDSKFSRLAEVPFSSEQQYMATLHKYQEGYRIMVKGSPEALLARSHTYFEDGAVHPLDDQKRGELHRVIEEMASRGLRLLATAYRPLDRDHLVESDVQSELVFCGLFGLIDPPRPDVMEAISKCKRAGIHVAMVTGDNPLTAKAIAQEIGIDGEHVMVGKEWSALDDKARRQAAEQCRVFARIEPLDKLKIVEAFQGDEGIVAMTGDGVNDAPALEKANIGIAMGITGTDVAKEAADMILSDDRFPTIVDAVEEGRCIFNRLRHAATFLLATCFGEVLTILLAFVLLGVSPLEPLQILWINLITGSTIAIPLGVEPKVGDELNYPPRSAKVGLIFPGMVFRIAFLSLLLCLGAFGLFYFYSQNGDLYKARSMVFCSIVLFEWLLAFNIRSDEMPVWKLGLFSNRLLTLNSGISLLLFALILYVPTFREAFHTAPLSLMDWFYCLLPGAIVFLAESIRKIIAPNLFSFGKWNPKSWH